jgi:hypothetical protein
MSGNCSLMVERIERIRLLTLSRVLPDHSSGATPISGTSEDQCCAPMPGGVPEYILRARVGIFRS